MSADTHDSSLRVLIANEEPERLGMLTDLLKGLGHVVVAAGTDLEEIGDATRRERPDVALVVLGESSDHGPRDQPRRGE